ncbi:MAG: tyrosine-type recombinase/integrase [Carboxydocellales bacterium]
MYSSCLDDYIEHMKQQGLRPSTIETRSIYASHFLVFIESQEIHELREINAGHVGAALVAIDSKEGFCEKVPPFMKYLYEANVTTKDFSCVIPRYTSCDRLPSVYDKGELDRLLTGIDRSTPIGKRNYAILMCAITYGMRVGDIVSLRFTDIDTENPKISFIQAKTGVPYNADLHPAVLRAITDYAEQGRPASDSPYIFLRSHAPYDRLSRGAVWSIVSTRLSACGIANGGRRKGPHTLRSSLASYLVNADVPYDIVRKILGHEDPNSTKHYVSIDIERLRKCALECPEPSEQFASYLKGGDWK